MKITAISPFNTARPRSIVELVSEIDSGLVILPGYADNIPSVAAIQKHLKPGVFVFLESAGKEQSKPWFVSREQTILMPAQVFGRNPRAQELRDLETCFPKRTFPLVDRQVSFILCGEINAFQPDGSTKKGIELPFDVLINPAHSRMGRWNVLDPKLTALSKGRVVIHVANNTTGSQRLTTDVRIYANGEKVGNREEKADAVCMSYEV